MAHRESCVGMAANVIGVRKRIIVCDTVLVKSYCFEDRLIEKADEDSREFHRLFLVAVEFL